MGTRFVEVPAEAIETLMRDVAAGVEKRGGKVTETRVGYERVWDVVLPSSRGAVVRLFSSLTLRGETVRDCGEDAVRIVVGAYVPGEFIACTPPYPHFAPSSESVRIFRTAPTKLAPAARVAAFIARLKEALRDAYGTAMNVPACPTCRTAMVLRRSRTGTFYGCASYPKCRVTRSCPQKRATSEVGA